MNERIDKSVSQLRSALLQCTSVKMTLARATEYIGLNLAACRSITIARNPVTAQTVASFEWSEEETDPEYDRALVKLVSHFERRSVEQQAPFLASNLKNDTSLPLDSGTFESLEINSALTTAVKVSEELIVTLSLFRKAGEDVWDEEEQDLFEDLAEEMLLRIIVLGQNLVTSAEDPQKEIINGRYRRLVENSEAIQFTVDSNNIITFVNRRALDFFGVVPEDFVSGASVEWFDLIHLEDRPSVRSRTIETQRRGLSFEEEFRVINHITGRERWLLVKLVPCRHANGQVIGWDGFGIDITSRKETQEALDLQSRKVRALYTVSNAIRGFLDPANIAARGLAALCEATEAHSGVCYLFDSPSTRTLSLVAHHGFANTNSNPPSKLDHNHLFASVAERGQSIVISDLNHDPRKQILSAFNSAQASCVIVPVAAEDEVFGALGLFHHSTGQFDGGDVMLVSAAANQIGLAARQAHLFSVYKKQTKNLSALYRMSHELSQFRSLEDTFQQAFSIIRDELGLKRIWLGLLDGSGTRIIGQAAYGPGWKRRLVEMNLEIEGETNPLREVIQTKHPIIVNEPHKLFAQTGLRRFFARFSITTITLVPLVSRGQILGVMAVQPEEGEAKLQADEVTLLSSLANEIASLLLTRRLEERLGEGERMRSAGLLAAGIAHNFNNLLQAVLGQASLLEMQRSNEAAVLKAAKVISESATKGAGLVRQLLSFSNLEEPHPVSCDINELIQREVANWSSTLGESLQLKLSLRAKLPKTFVDPRHLSRILSVLISNAVEAMKDRSGPIQVFTDLVSTQREMLHIEVPEGRYVRVGVRDSGIGMDAETRRRCFEPFFTTKNVDPSSGLSLTGSGLGLAAAYALARRNGGRLVAESKQGHGSVFTFYVPIEKTASKPLTEQLEVYPADSLPADNLTANNLAADNLSADKGVGVKGAEVKSNAAPTKTTIISDGEVE